MTQPVAVEIAVQDSAGARIAYASGASRIELCAALPETGGITPTQSLIQQAVGTGIDVHVLIRCRPGGFIFTPDEIDVMVGEIESARHAGAKGVVVGAATVDGELDLEALKKFAGAAGEMNVSLHRVVDIVPDRLAAIHAVHDLGFTRILTSAGQSSAVERPDLLAEMVTVANTLGVEIMAGGGIRVSNVDLLADTGVHAVHSSCSVKDTTTGPSGPGGGASVIARTDGQAIKELVARVAAWGER